MPSRLRRTAVICGYLVLTLIAFSMVLETEIVRAGLISVKCDTTDVCSRSEEILMTAVGLAILATCAAWIVLGWKAKLPGARRA